MSLFQNSVIKKYLKGLETSKVDEAWNIFTAHFHNKTIQENIRNSKEEQYQGEFLIDLFVNVLGYTKNPTPNFNLTTELKNVKGAKKTDGAILKDEKALAVIELKGTNTTDLNKVENQAFGYKNNQPGCVYVITSNFEKLRFYIDNAVDFEEFNLFQLSRERFDLLWLCLSSEYLLKNTPKQIKDESLTQEENVTKQLYKDYSLFRNEIFDSIQKNNPEHDKLTLFKKTQKLLDRFLFIFFAEDRLLLPPNSIREIINQWTTLRDELDAYVPLYSRFKKYFSYMNTGYKGKKHDIFAYNGGLFAPDEILDSIKIDDALLFKHTQNLSNYDFESEVSVNILGHIFEHSLNEIEEIQAELEGIETDKSKSKRKKDGVFYTPKYITKYIVDNTVGKLCEEKKTELEIDEAEYEKDRKGRKKTTLKALLKKLEDYRKWLLDLTICDPACGSGAFLNQALEFLISEHQYIDELNAKLLGEAMILRDIENAILENNLFGVDINEESVEIAKLSLWLRTAQKGRKLTLLNNNIKCGNSLIDDREIAGDKAFNWQNEFPKVFEKGGFDVVIGNPPYVRQELLSDIKPYLEEHYESYAGTADLFTYFYEKGIAIFNKKGLMSFITNDFNKTTSSTALRKFLQEQTNFISYDDLSEVEVFKGTTTYPVILTISKITNDKFYYCKYSQKDTASLDLAFEVGKVEISQSQLDETNWIFKSDAESNLFNKISDNETIKSIVGKSYRGIVTGFNEAFIINQEIKDKIITANSNDALIVKPFLEGRDIQKWESPLIDKFIIFTRRGIEIENYPAIKEWLLQYKERLTPRNSPEQKIGRKAGKYKWFEIQDSVDYYELFDNPKITWTNLQNKNKFSFDNKDRYINAPAVILPTNDKALLAILNSKIVWYFLTQICVVRSGGYIEVKPQYFEQIPVPDYSNQKDILISHADNQIDNTSKKQNIESKFIRLLLRKFSIEKLSKKLQNWNKITFEEFVKELKKKKIKLGLAEEAEWEEYFEAEKEKVQTLQAAIDKTDKEIDQIIYELYGLTKEEINIVEEATA